MLNEDFNTALSKIKREKTILEPNALYHGVVNISEYHTYLMPASIFIQSSCDDLRNLPSFKLDPNDSIENQLAELINEANREISTINFDLKNTAALEFYVHQIAPSDLATAGWLKNTTRLSYAENKSGLILQEIVKEWLTFTTSEFFDGQNIRSMFHKLTDSSMECGDSSFAVNKNIRPFAFEYALSALCLGLFPAKYMLEISGFNLWHATVGVKSLLRDLSTSKSENYTELTSNIEKKSTALINQLLCEKWCEEQDHNKKIIDGFLLAHSTYMRWRESLVTHLNNLSPQNRMLRLLESKAKYMKGFHENIRINGKQFDTYMDEGASGYIKLLKALKESSFVNLKQPHLSPLITQSTSIKGKMFGVFTLKEIGTITDWIEDKSEEKLDCFSYEEPALVGKYTAPMQKKDMHDIAKQALSSKNIQELTYYIANYDKFPLIAPVLDLCANFVTDILAKSARVTCPEKYIPLYSLNALEIMLENNRQLQVREYEMDNEPLLTGEALVAKYISAFPSYCTDGCWLDGTFQPGKMYSKEYKILYDIYRDENGAGDFKAHHNYIARELLQSMGYQFPSIEELAFYQQEDIGASFVTPFIQYSLSALTPSFLPEVLGINLMLETNDISSVNRRNSKELKASGYDPLYMDLHIVIDNYASGHGHMAKRAIISLIENAGRIAGDYKQTIWERIFFAYTGLNNLYNNSSNPEIQRILIDIKEFTIDKTEITNERGKLSVAKI